MLFLFIYYMYDPFVVEELYKIYILACLLYNCIFICRRCFFLVIVCAVWNLISPVLDIEGMKFPVMDYSWYESSIGHRVYEISSNGLFMVLVQYWTYSI